MSEDFEPTDTNSGVRSEAGGGCETGRRVRRLPRHRPSGTDLSRARRRVFLSAVRCSGGRDAEGLQLEASRSALGESGRAMLQSHSLVSAREAPIPADRVAAGWAASRSR